MHPWREVGDRVFVRRYRFWDQEIGLVLGRDAALVVDTRISPRQAEEILADVRSLTTLPVEIVVNTHAHSDHCFGNSRFRPATIWGHERAVTFLRETGERQRTGVAAQAPEVAAELAEVTLDPPDRTFTERATLDMSGREVKLRFLGRGHTDHDIVLVLPDADVVFAGDLLENGAPPYFGDGYPIDWPATAAALLALVGPGTTVVPGHGDVADRAFVEASHASFVALAELARRIDRDGFALDEVLAEAPWGGGPPLREALQRGLAQLRGDLDRS